MDCGRLKWFGPPVPSCSVIFWKPPNNQAEGGWTEKGAAWLEPRSRWGPSGVPLGSFLGLAGIGASGRALGVAVVSLAVPLPVAFSLRTILILLIVDVPFFSPPPSLVWAWISACQWNRKLTLCSAEPLPILWLKTRRQPVAVDAETKEHFQALVFYLLQFLNK